MVKIWEAIKGAGRWVRRIFEDSDGLPSSKRVAGLGLIVTGAVYLIASGDPVGAGVLIGAGLGALGVSSWKS